LLQDAAVLQVVSQNCTFFRRPARRRRVFSVWASRDLYVRAWRSSLCLNAFRYRKTAEDFARYAL